MFSSDKGLPGIDSAGTSDKSARSDAILWAHLHNDWQCLAICHNASCGVPGGRVTGAEVISELITELDASVEAAAGFEGEMQRLSGYARCASAV